jgi:hypothetical protein
MTFTASITRVLCDGGNEGGIKLNPAGGTAPYTALWSNGESGLSLTDLAPGVYSATVIDANGCNKDTTISLEAASTYSIETSVTNATCDGAASGSAQVNIVNGTTPPYTYLWSTGDTIETLNNIVAGTYSVTVSDSLDCLRDATATVGTNSGLTIPQQRLTHPVRTGLTALLPQPFREGRIPIAMHGTRAQLPPR